MHARSKRKLLVWLGSLFCLSFLTVPQTVQAQPFDPFDGFRVESHSIEFSANDATVVRHPEVVTEQLWDLPAPPAIIPAVTLVEDGETCRTVKTKITGNTTGGEEMWAYHLSIDWCYGPDDVEEPLITYVGANRWGTVKYPVWRFVGHVSDTESGGEGQTSFTYRTYGVFCLGVEAVEELSCVQEARPWIELTVYADGTWEGTGGNSYS